MVRLNFDAEAIDLLGRVESDPDAAAGAMRMAAKYIREEQPLPAGLREWIANALDDAALKPRANRAKALTDALSLTVGNRRPAGDWYAIGAEVEMRMTSDAHIESVAEDIAGKYEIDRRTVKRYWEKYQKARAQHDAAIE